MPFTESDSLKEIVLKVMIAEAAAGEGSISPENKEVILEWMKRLEIEGPERGRIKSLLEMSFDGIQIEIFFNQLHAALADRYKKEGIKIITDTMLKDRNKIFPLESRLQAKINEMQTEESLVERIYRHYTPDSA